MNKTFLLSPSILSANFANLQQSMNFLSDHHADWVHIDVMDGHFVPNLTIGAPVVKALRACTELPFDVHLMVTNPADHLDAFIDAGADYITFHIEAIVHAHRLAVKIREAGKKVGISIVPSTPIALIRELLPYLDLVLVMTVDPGFGGQTIIPSCIEKVRELKKIQRETGFSYMISVDGGINSHTIAEVLDAGSDVIVSGSAFFSGELDAVIDCQ